MPQKQVCRCAPSTQLRSPPPTLPPPLFIAQWLLVVAVNPGQPCTDDVACVDKSGQDLHMWCPSHTNVCEGTCNRVAQRSPPLPRTHSVHFGQVHLLCGVVQFAGTMKLRPHC